MALYPKRVIAWDRLDNAMEEVLLTVGGRARRVVQSMIDLSGGGTGGGGGIGAAEREQILGVRYRTDANEQAPTAQNWSPRPTGYAAVLSIGAAPNPSDAGPLDVRVGRAPTGVTETVTTFSLADGSAWPAPWTIERVPTGGGATVSGSRGVLTTGSAGSSAVADEVAARYGGSHTDSNVLLTFRHATSAARPTLVLRSDQANLSPSDAVRVGFHSGALTVSNIASGTATQVATAAKTWTVGADYRLRVVATGSTLQAHTWPLANPEPSTWDVTAAVAKTAGGYLGLVVGGTTASTGAVQAVQWDDIEITSSAASGYGVNYGNTWGA